MLAPLGQRHRKCTTVAHWANQRAIRKAIAHNSGNVAPEVLRGRMPLISTTPYNVYEAACALRLTVAILCHLVTGGAVSRVTHAEHRSTGASPLRER
eukprot:6971024-Karenia_brevis.AAC.1